jgi:HSP20 family protein
MTRRFVIGSTTCYNSSRQQRMSSHLNKRRCSTMLMRTDPFREFDRLTQQLLGGPSGTWSRPTAMPLDAWREKDEYVIACDIPGVDPEAIDIDVERNMLTVKAERRPATGTDEVEMQVSERPFGAFSRQLFLGDTLAAERIQATYEAGVLTLRIPVTERAKPRKIEINAEAEPKSITA